MSNKEIEALMEFVIDEFGRDIITEPELLGAPPHLCLRVLRSHYEALTNFCDGWTAAMKYNREIK
jgi:hypothetical protein